MLILQILSLILWLVAIPFCIGLLPIRLLNKQLRSPGIALISGYIVLFVLLELIGIPIVLTMTYHSFSTFCICFAGTLVVFASVGIVLTVKSKKKLISEGDAQEKKLKFPHFDTWKNYKIEEKIMLVIFLLLVGFQLYMAFTRASFDGDDAYYGVQALTAQLTDTMYRIDPNNGWSTTLDVRHALALFPIWEAFIGQMSGMHATIVSHSVIPLLLIPLTYIIYYHIGKVLFETRKDLVPMFMVIMALWQMFGNISIYTTETFFLTRTWQGKSFAGNFVIPAVLWIFLSLFSKEHGKETKGFWILLACLNLAGGASSSLAVLLSLLLTAGLAVLFTLKERKFSILMKAGLTCISGGIYVLLYLLLTHGFIKL
jgi:hypothetical protein